MIRVGVFLEGRYRTVPFLIDPGAEATVLHPVDADRILTDGWRAIDFAADARRIRGLGTGGNADRVVRNATLTLRSVDSESLTIEMPILIAQPMPAEPGEHGNWRLPSLLGRDFLRRFRLELLCGEQRSVLLETP